MDRLSYLEIMTSTPTITGTLTNPLTSPFASAAASIATDSVAHLDQLAELVAVDGIAAHHASVVAAIRASGLASRFPVLTDLVVDATAPPVARERALGRLAGVAPSRVLPVRRGVTTVWQSHAA